jgi:hypothetical protein
VSLVALLLVLVAAALHANWNFMVKKVEDKHVFTWWALELAQYRRWRERARQSPGSEGPWIGIGVVTVVKALGA